MAGKSGRSTPRGRSKAKAGSAPSKSLIKQVADYVAYLQVPMRLQDWTVTVDGSRWAPDAYADMTSYPDQKRAVMRVGEGFVDLDGEEQTQTLVHEMTHCHLFAVQHAFDRLIGDAYPRGSARELAQHLAESNVEVATDAIADALFPFVDPFPLSATGKARSSSGKAHKARK